MTFYRNIEINPFQFFTIIYVYFRFIFIYVNYFISIYLLMKS